MIQEITASGMSHVISFVTNIPCSMRSKAFLKSKRTTLAMAPLPSVERILQTAERVIEFSERLTQTGEWLTQPFKRFKKRFKDLLIVESALNSLSSYFTGTPLKYLETNNSNTGLKIPTGVAEDFNSGPLTTDPASGQSGTRTRDRGIACPTR